MYYIIKFYLIIINLLEKIEYIRITYGVYNILIKLIKTTWNEILKKKFYINHHWVFFNNNITIFKHLNPLE